MISQDDASGSILYVTTNKSAALLKILKSAVETYDMLHITFNRSNLFLYMEHFGLLLEITILWFLTAD